MAQTTANYGFNIAEGTDVVNLLTQCYPNFTSLDSILKRIDDNGVTTASETKVGTVHQLVRTDNNCNIFRFTATSNFVLGDSFTVDGSPVSAVTVAGTALQTGDFVINSNVLAIVNGGVLTVFAGAGTVNPDAQDVTYDNSGSGLTATNVQDAIDEVTSGLDTVTANVSTYVSGTILAGNTSITLSDASILTTSFIDVYFKDKVLAPTNVTVAVGSVTVEIAAEATDTEVAVRIANL